MKKELQSEASGRERRGYSRGVAGFIRRQGLPRNTFELCLTHTAKNRNRILKPKLGRAAGATQTHSRQKFQNPKGFSTLRVAQKVRILAAMWLTDEVQWG